jgi:uncharacterized protein (DUF2147 family)
MRIARPAAIAVAMLCAGAATSRAAAAEAPTVYGLWLNPRKSVEVQTRSCGPTLCGSIVWANAEAVSDARDAGIDKLMGLQLLSGYRQKGRGLWQGRVYVPDLGRSFFSRIEQIAPDRLKISGCILGGVLCKSQTWTRL